MTMTLELPEDVAEKVRERPEKERHNFAVAAMRRGFELTDRGQAEMAEIRIPVEKVHSFPLTANANHPLAPVWGRIRALSDLSENWNGHEIAAPNPDAIANAGKWLGTLYREVSEVQRRWINPHVAANEEGDVAFEWAQGGRKIIVYISPKHTFYIKAWGPSVATEMADGDAMTPEERLALWDWLTGARDNG